MIYISHLLEDSAMRRVLQNRILGVESIEFSIGYCLDRWQESVDSYRRRLEHMPHQSLSLHGPFLDLNPASYDSLVRNATKVRFEQSYQAALALGAEKIIYHTCFVPQINYLEGWPQQIAAFWKEFLADKDERIQIHMENVFDPTYAGIREVFEQVQHPAFSMCIDLGHAHAFSEIPVEEWIEQMGTYIGHIHVHDNNGIADEHRAAGEGSICWEHVNAALKKYCPKADCTIENSNIEDVEKSLAFLGE